MIIKDINSSEGYVHLCDDYERYRVDYIKNRPTVFIHDWCHNLWVQDEKSKRWTTVYVEYCPYCGKRIDQDQRNDEIVWDDGKIKKNKR